MRQNREGRGKEQKRGEAGSAEGIRRAKKMKLERK